MNYLKKLIHELLNELLRLLGSEERAKKKTTVIIDYGTEQEYAPIKSIEYDKEERVKFEREEKKINRLREHFNTSNSKDN